MEVEPVVLRGPEPAGAPQRRPLYGATSRLVFMQLIRKGILQTDRVLRNTVFLMLIIFLCFTLVRMHTNVWQRSRVMAGTKGS